MPGNRHFFVPTKSGAAAKMLGDVVSAYRMPTPGARQPTFFPFRVQRKPYTNERAKRAGYFLNLQQKSMKYAFVVKKGEGDSPL